MQTQNNMNSVNEQERNKLFIVGLNVDANHARYERAAGRLERIAKNIYIDTTISPIDRRSLITKNAARIAKTLFPQGMLAGSSAFHRGAVEGHLMITTQRGGEPIDIGGVFKIYHGKSELDIGMNNEAVMIAIEDSFGSNNIKRLSDEMLIIKNFMVHKNRPRNTYLNNTDLNRIIERCGRYYADPEKFIVRLLSLAEAHGMKNYSRQIQTYVENTSNYFQTERPINSFNVFWHKTQVATLSNDGHVWSFEYERQVLIQLSLNEKKGRGSPPSFLGSLLPEVGVRATDTMEENLGNFSMGHRYISNITVRPNGIDTNKEIIIDMLDGELDNSRSDYAEFSGPIGDELLSVMEDSARFDRLLSDPNSPRMSGMQIKIAANLARDGSLDLANGRSFTHLIKTVGSNPKHQSMCSMEWFSLMVARDCGLNVEKFAVLDIGGYGPSLVVERFDVRRDLNDTRMILAEDFWSIEGLTVNNHKYNGDLMSVADTVMKHSTDTEVDSRHLLGQSVFSWLTANSDMHLKNLTILKSTKDPRSGFDSIRLSPIYDILCTQVYPTDAPTSAIALGGNKMHTLAGFRALGKKMGIKVEEVDAIVLRQVLMIPQLAIFFSKNLPWTISAHAQSVTHIKKAVDIFTSRCYVMQCELDGPRRVQGRKKQAGDKSDKGNDGDVESFSAKPLSLALSDSQSSFDAGSDEGIKEPVAKRRP